MKASQMVLHPGSQNLYSGTEHTISSQMNMMRTCYPIFAQCTYGIFFLLGEEFQIQSTLSILLVNNLKQIKKKTRIVKIGTLQ